MNEIIYSNTPEETMNAGYEFAKMLKPGDIVALNGDLGMGKTVFVKGICSYFRVKDYVVSPSYTLLNVYSGETDIYHFDIYRLETEDDLFNIGYYEYENAGGIVIVEWAEMLPEVFEKDNVFQVLIEREGDSGRKITVKKES